MPDVAEALHSLKAAGFGLYVVTNQPDIARGVQTREAVDEINRALGQALPIDGFYICPHDDSDGCDCRKPKPGLLIRAAAEHGISIAASYMIGDRWRDVEAGQRAGCRSIWLDFGYAERAPSSPADAILNSLTEAAAWILTRKDAR
jgi:D-glycero-D-manno-heptose 1,7-bisphosphate phosphatase